MEAGKAKKVPHYVEWESKKHGHCKLMLAVNPDSAHMTIVPATTEDLEELKSLWSWAGSIKLVPGLLELLSQTKGPTG
jgi:hypothetical protein